MGCLKLDIPPSKISLLTVVSSVRNQPEKSSGKCLDFGARNYIKTANVFDGPDPISSQFPHVTTINYAENSPVSHIDLWGLQAWEINRSRLKGEVKIPSKRAEGDWVGPAIGYTLAGLAAIGGGAAAIGRFGLNASAAFVANEIKDEVASKLSGGVTDILDATKLGAKLIREGSSKVFRAVGGGELEDISTSEMIRPGEGSMETKLFTDNLADAMKQGEATGKDFSIISFDVPNSTLKQLESLEVDTYMTSGKTISVQPDKLDLFNSTRGKVSLINN
jgi:hypothetical protein